ncbi:MAG: sulfite exporter TauE/SafE family protein [Armatimonadota bacterium]
MIHTVEYLLIGLAAIAAGMVNALAGGGTLITFPVLMAVGIPAVAANVTNTVALCPGYLGATLAQFKDIKDQRQRLWWCIPASIVGGLIGGILLLRTEERMFRTLVPFLILLASGLLALQDPMRAWLQRQTQVTGKQITHNTWVIIPIGLAAIYGGYFGAGLSVIVLAILGLVFEGSLTKLNALKQAISLTINVTAAIFFVFSGQVVWKAALVMAVGALIGGSIGGRLASRIKPSTLRWLVVTIGVVVAVIYIIQLYMP